MNTKTFQVGNIVNLICSGFSGGATRIESRDCWGARLITKDGRVYERIPLYDLSLGNYKDKAEFIGL